MEYLYAIFNFDFSSVCGVEKKCAKHSIYSLSIISFLLFNTHITMRINQLISSFYAVISVFAKYISATQDKIYDGVVGYAGPFHFTNKYPCKLVRVYK